MIDIDKKIKINNLLDYYGNLLTDKQFEMMKYYYQEDFSLAEISEKEHISRQAVHDSLVKSEAVLENLEFKLGFFKKSSEIKFELHKLLKDASDEQQIQINKIIGLI